MLIHIYQLSKVKLSNHIPSPNSWWKASEQSADKLLLPQNHSHQLFPAKLIHRWFTGDLYHVSGRDITTCEDLQTVQNVNGSNATMVDCG